jgi:hypothetical protein
MQKLSYAVSPAALLPMTAVAARAGMAGQLILNCKRLVGV